MPSRWEQIVVDAQDPGQLARWWAEALDYVIVHEEPDEVEIRRSADELPGLLDQLTPQGHAPQGGLGQSSDLFGMLGGLLSK